MSGAYGIGYLDAAGVAIDEDVFLDGRIDTVAHELGHNLGLDHNDFDGSNLMASGGVRQVPATIADIYPHPPGIDQLSGSEIAIARSSDLLTVAVPEPDTLA